ncbi:Nucleolar protein 13 [Coemansia erecta]|uniref:Nucleolar protein 13 n=1 Tax=Coemansia erecta TaxID=147472 RepID=A0A9W7Y2V8_9FUNG|nr:Nucleolar protein 13 [Coemansia erecta]
MATDKTEKVEGAVPVPSVSDTNANTKTEAETQPSDQKKKKEKTKESKDGDAKKDKSKKPKKSKGKGGDKKPEPEPKVRSPYSIWIGNLPYTVTKDDIRKFFEPCGGEITRVNLPKKDGKICGFAHVDFNSAEPVNLALAYSEQKLGGRAVLIKDATDFTKTGAPSRVLPLAKEVNTPAGDKAKTPNAAGAESKKGKKDASSFRSKNAPSPSLFVGNLSFDVKRRDLKALFKPFGELVGVRVATFEDNPEKCKGFAYIDFKYTDNATKAMQSSELKEIAGRRTRIEYAGEEATRKGRPWEFDPRYKFAQPKHGFDRSDNGGRQNKRQRTFNATADADGDSDGDVSMDGGRKEYMTRSKGNPAGRAGGSGSQDPDVVINNMEAKTEGYSVKFEGSKITFGD